MATQVAQTPSESVYVSRDQPYRVLRIEPTTAGSAMTGELALAQAASSWDAKRIDLTEFDPARAAQFYTELGDRVRELADAADATLEIHPRVRPRSRAAPPGARSP